MQIPRWLLVCLDSFIDPDDVLIASFLSDKIYSNFSWLQALPLSFLTDISEFNENWWYSVFSGIELCAALTTGLTGLTGSLNVSELQILALGY